MQDTSEHLKPKILHQATLCPGPRHLLHSLNPLVDVPLIMDHGKLEVRLTQLILLLVQTQTTRFNIKNCTSKVCMDLQLSKCRTVVESRVRSPDRVPGQLDLIALPERPTVAHQVSQEEVLHTVYKVFLTLIIMNYQNKQLIVQDLFQVYKYRIGTM